MKRTTKGKRGSLRRIAAMAAGMLMCLLLAVPGVAVLAEQAQEGDTSGDAAAYELNYSGLTAKLDNVYYDVEFAYSNPGYLYNATPTTGDIHLSYETIEEEHDFTDPANTMNGLVRAKTFSKPDYAYEGNYWYIYGNHIAGSGNRNFYTAGQTTAIDYSVTDNKFTVTKDGTPVDDTEFSGYTGNTVTLEGLDADGACYIATSVSNGGYQSAKVTNFKMTDAEGYDLGFAFNQKNLTSSSSQRYGITGQTITLKAPADADIYALGLYGDDGQKLDVEITEPSEGIYTFTMPAQNVTVKEEQWPAYTLEYTGAVAKMDNVYYDIEFEYNANGYLYNETPTAGDIHLSFDTITEEHNFTNMNGVVRGTGFSDIVSAYVGNYWLVYGNHVAGSGNRSFHQAGASTVIDYSTTDHKFTITIDGVVVSETGMSGFVGNTVTLEQVDTTAAESGTGYIAINSSNGGYQSAHVTNFKMTDADGYDLGFAFSTHNLTSSSSQRYGIAGKTITLKVDEGDGFKELAFYNEAGERLDIDAAAQGGGIYTFTMPEENVSVEAVTYVDSADFYGSYYNAEKGETIVIGEESGIRSAQGFVAYTVKIASDDSIDMTAEESTISGTILGETITVDGSVYTMLRSYFVTFVYNDGVTAETRVTVDSGEYKVTKPADPTREGYVFKGWVTADGTAFDFNSVVDRSITLYASWEPEGGVTEPEESKSGCGGTLYASAIGAASLVLLAAATGVIIVGRKS